MGTDPPLPRPRGIHDATYGRLRVTWDLAARFREVVAAAISQLPEGLAGRLQLEGLLAALEGLQEAALVATGGPVVATDQVDAERISPIHGVTRLMGWRLVTGEQMPR